jgi:two-component system sensor histidine kinase/response regulator
VRLLRRKLAFRLVLPIVASTLLIFCVFSVLLFRSFHSLLELELKERAQALSETFTMVIENNASDAVAIRLSSLLGSSEDIEHFMILDLISQRVLGASRWEYSNHTLSQIEILEPYTEYLQGRTAYYFQVKDGSRGILISKIKTFSTDRITRRHLALFAVMRTERLTAGTKEQYYKVLGLLGVSLFLLGIFAFASAYAHVVRPLALMTNNIQQGHRFGLPALIRYRSDNELGKLSKAYNDHVMDAYRAGLAQKEAMKKVNEASKAKSIFLSTMSHEIRTPMNGVLGMVQILNKTDMTEYQRRCLELIKTSGESLVEIINDVLDFSKIEANKLVLESVPFSLEKLCVDILTLMKAQTRDKGLHLYLDFGLEMPKSFIGDPVRIRQVITNLVGNAIKFTNQGSVGLTVTKSQDSSDGVIFSITDTGVGISVDQQARLFDAFSQADASTTRKYGGTGLGLAISKKIVGLMQGDISVSSEPGRGSTFKVTLCLPEQTTSINQHKVEYVATAVLINFPWYLEKIMTKHGQDVGVGVKVLRHIDELQKITDLAKETPIYVFTQELYEKDVIRLYETYSKIVFVVEYLDVFLSLPDKVLNVFVEMPCMNKEWLQWLYRREVDPADQRKLNMPQAALQGKVLLAEDAPVNQMVAKELLEHMGLEVIIANDGLEALQAIQCERDIQLILMDCMMPNMDGYDATREIRKLNGNLGKLPIVALTANVIEDARQDCMDAGMDDFLSKPFSEQELRGCMTRWLTKSSDPENLDQKNA